MRINELVLESGRVCEGSDPQPGDEVYHRNRLVGWYKGYNSNTNKVIIDPDVEEVGDDYIGRDLYLDKAGVVIKPKSQDTAEGLGAAIARGVGKLSKGVGAVAGGAHGAWDTAKQGYAAGKAAVAGTAPTQQPQATSDPVQVAYDKGVEDGKAQALDLDQLKQQSTQKRAQGQADQQTAFKQMANTQQSNAQAAQADAALKAAVKAAKAKPAFQQTAQDKITIKKGAEKGIFENKKLKTVGFTSAFLGTVI